MSTAPRRPLAEMTRLAEQLVDQLAPCCERLEIAGSIRRQKPDVADIELVAVPRIVPAGGLFGDVPQNCVDAHIAADLATFGHFDLRLDTNGHPRQGPRYKALLWRPTLDAAEGVPVDLFSVLPDTDAQWGLIYLLRTGPADFGKRLVTSTAYGGWLPAQLQVKDGAIRERQSGRILPTPEEQQVFEVLGRAYLPPERRG